ncbi:hypothetical protein BX666DRAFT_2125174 [Dichotomocladium elegans]|nr:hypothetical protein BX666DRAFT_2125174 [Dichotomocladium elegans]
MDLSLFRGGRFQSFINEIGVFKQKLQESIASEIALSEAGSAKKGLLENPNFRLIHVHKNAQGQQGKQVMNIVTPAWDNAIYNAVNQQGYYTVSHLWGQRENWRLWTNHGIVGPRGEKITAKVLPEKQAAILSLLLSTPGFWWIDMFCSQSDTPPSIMGDVYRFCARCVALIDFPTAKFSRIRAVGERLGDGNTVKPDDQRLNEIANCYRERIYDRTCSGNRTWNESLDDLLGGWYRGDPEDIKALAEFFSCRWFTRVWTLQDYALPSQLIFINESDPELHRIDRNLTTFIIRVLCTVVNKVFLSYIQSDANGESLDVYNSLPAIGHIYAMNTTGLARCYSDLARLDAMTIHGFYAIGSQPGVMATSFRHVSRSFDPLVLILKKLAKTQRTCLYPRDYVYGVCRLLDLEIDIAENDNDVWSRFRMAILRRAPDLTIPETFTLSAALSLQDVYGMFISEDARNCSTIMDMVNKIWH